MAEAVYSMVEKPLVEGPRRQEALQQLLRHRLAGAVMPGMGAQDLRLFEPMLIELRGQFHEIAGHRRAREERIGDVREKAVERMAELVEQGARVVEGEQRCLTFRRLGEVHHVDDDRRDGAVEPLL